MLRRIALGVGLWFQVVLALPSGALAATILQSDNRRIQIPASDLGCSVPGGDAFFGPPAPFAPFHESRSYPVPVYLGAVTATQDSTVSLTHMGGTGSANAGGVSSHFCGVSRFSVTFQLTSSTPYEFNGTLTDASTPFSPIFSLTRIAAPGETNFSESLVGNGSQLVSKSGVLAAGTYVLDASARAGPGDSSWSFDFALVPEPSTASLLAIGLAGLGLRKRGHFVRR